MKRFILFIAIISTLSAKAQHPQMRVFFVDSASMNQVASWLLPQVAISGYYDNLLHIPSISINGVSQSVTNGASWTVSTSVPATTILPKSANYTITTSDFGTAKVLYMPIDCTSGNVTITTPSASSITGYTIIFTKTDATANILTISGLTYDNLIGVQNQSRETISNGTSYIQN